MLGKLKIVGRIKSIGYFGKATGYILCTLYIMWYSYNNVHYVAVVSSSQCNGFRLVGQVQVSYNVRCYDRTVVHLNWPPVFRCERTINSEQWHGKVEASRSGERGREGVRIQLRISEYPETACLGHSDENLDFSPLL